MNQVHDNEAESADQLAMAWMSIVSDHRDSGDTRDISGLSIRWADSKFVFFNTITLTEVGKNLADLKRDLQDAASYMRGKKNPGLVWIFEELLASPAQEKLPEVAAEAGFEIALKGYGMVGDILPVPEPVHPGLTFERVVSEEQLIAYADINAEAYGMPKDDVRDGLAGSNLWKTGMFAYLGVVDGVPVSAAATMKVGDCLFLVLFATRPAEQRKGYGEATLRKALFEEDGQPG